MRAAFRAWLVRTFWLVPPPQHDPVLVYRRAHSRTGVPIDTWTDMRLVSRLQAEREAGDPLPKLLKQKRRHTWLAK